MSVPWTPEFTERVLAGMGQAQLARVTPASFQTYPCQIALPADLGRDLIAQERARRANVARTGERREVMPAASALTVSEIPLAPPIPELAPAPPPTPGQGDLFG